MFFHYENRGGTVHGFISLFDIILLLVILISQIATRSNSFKIITEKSIDKHSFTNVL